MLGLVRPIEIGIFSNPIDVSVCEAAQRLFGSTPLTAMIEDVNEKKGTAVRNH
jgi:hypothetical protein